MKKRVFSLILAAAVAVLNLSLLPAVSAATATVATYYDINFDAGNWDNKAESGLTLNYQTKIGSGTWTHGIETEPIRNNAALKVTAPADATSGALWQANNNSGLSVEGLSQYVTWYEMSFKWEKTILDTIFVPCARLINIVPDGSIYLGGLKDNGNFRGTLVNNFKCETDEWYHIVIAVDYVNTFTNSSNQTFPRLYAWMNGKLLTTDGCQSDGALVWSGTSLSAKDQFSSGFFTLHPDTQTEGVFWLDNYKMYTTQTSVANTQYDPTDIFDGAELTSESLLIQNNVIYADGGQTLADVDALLIKPASGVTYFDGNTPVSDMNEAAVGKTVYARSIGGVGVMKYTIAEKTDFMVAKEYYDINFDDGAWTNQADSGMIYGYDTKVGVAAAAQEVTTEPVRENKALKISLPTGASNELYRLAKKSGETVSGLGQYATWYEMSFKFDGAVLDTAFQPSAYIFNVTPDGTVYLGGKYNFGSNNGTPANNFKCETGEWYHFVAAVDYVNAFTNDAGNTYARFYAWINGKLLTTANSGDCTMYWSNATVDTLKKDAIDVARLTIVPNTEKAGAFWMDNFKVYTTYNAVVNEDGALCFDPMAVMNGTEVTSNTYRVADGAVYIPADATLAQVQQNLDISGTAVYMKGNTVAGDSAAAAAGVDIHVRAANGIGVKKYSLTESTGLERISAEWMKNGSTPTASAGEFTTGDSAGVSLRLANNTAERKDMILVTAAYCGERLSGCKITDVSLAAGEVKTVASDALAVSEAEGLTLKAFLWNSVQTLQAETDAVILR